MEFNQNNKYGKNEISFQGVSSISDSSVKVEESKEKWSVLKKISLVVGIILGITTLISTIMGLINYFF